MSRIIALAIASVVFAVATPAAAQVFADEEGDGTGNQVLYFSSATTTSTAVGMAIIVATVVTVTPDQEAAQAERYLRENAVALETDLVLGAGSTVDDLAMFLRISDAERSSFGRALRAHSNRLLELADPKRLTPQRAGTFLRVARQALAESRDPDTTST